MGDVEQILIYDFVMRELALARAGVRGWGFYSSLMYRYISKEAKAVQMLVFQR